MTEKMGKNWKRGRSENKGKSKNKVKNENRESSKNREGSENRGQWKKELRPALAVWALLARSSFYKIFAVMAVMAPVEVLLFYRSIKTEWEYYTEYSTLEMAFEKSHLSAVFLAALGLVYFILAWTEGRMDTVSGATMKRLRLSEGRIFAIKTVYNIACLTVLFAVQIWLCIWMTGAYGRETAGEMYASPQRLFLAFYRIDFLHSLMPMAEAGKWVRNVLLLLAFGMEAAVGAGKAEKKKYVPMIPLYVLTASWFVSPMGRNVQELIFDGVCTVIIAANLWQVNKTGEKNARINAARY